MPIQTRLPTGDSSTDNGFTASSGGSKFADVDDPIGSPDDDTTYISKVGANASQSFTFTPFSLGSSVASVNNLTITLRVKRINTSLNINSRLKVGGTVYDFGAGLVAGTTYGTRSEVWITNPATGLAWIKADIEGTGPNPLQEYGIRNTQTAGTEEARCTQVYAGADYNNTNFKDVASRFVQRVSGFKDTLARFVLQSRSFKDTSSRFRQTVQAYQHVATRVVQYARGYKDSSTRFRLTVTAARDISSRFTQGVLGLFFVGSRFYLSVNQWVGLASRFVLIVLNQADAPGRFRQTASGSLEASVRFVLEGRNFSETAGRFIQAVLSFSDSPGRYRLIAESALELSGRFVQSVFQSIDVASRFPQNGGNYGIVSGRLLMRARGAEDAGARFILRQGLRDLTPIEVGDLQFDPRAGGLNVDYIVDGLFFDPRLLPLKL